MNTWLTMRAWTELLYIDLVGVRGFHAVHRVIRRTPTRAVTAPPTTVAEVVHAMKTACVFYFKAPQCLQRSAVVTRLLRRRGVPAQMIVGCHLPPLKAHSWVEVAGKVVSDHQHGLEFYQILDRW